MKTRSPFEGDLNARLLREGGDIFSHIPGFETVLWARRIGTEKRREADFVLFNPASPRLGVVEATAALSGDWKQLIRYVGFFQRQKPDRLLEVLRKSLPNRESSRRLRAGSRAAANAASSLAKWLMRRKDAGARILKAAGKSLTAILLVYIILDPRGDLRFRGEMKLPSPRALLSRNHDWRLVVVTVE